MATSQTTIEWPKTYTFEDFCEALMKFPETSAIKDDEKIEKFSALIASMTGTSDVLRLPAPFNQVSYFTEFINRVNKAKTTMINDVFGAMKKEILKIKEFVTNKASREPELRKLIEEESSPTRGQLLADPMAAENVIAGLYNTDKNNVKVYGDHFNRMKYGLQCIVWGEKIDKDVFKGENAEMQQKFDILEKLANSLEVREKNYLIDLLRNFIRLVVVLFIIRRTNVSFGDKDCYKLSYYFKSMLITRLKELVVFDKNYFVLPDGTEITEKTNKAAHDKIKESIKYDQEMDRAFGHYVIDVTKLR